MRGFKIDIVRRQLQITSFIRHWTSLNKDFIWSAPIWWSIVRLHTLKVLVFLRFTRVQPNHRFFLICSKLENKRVCLISKWNKIFIILSNHLLKQTVVLALNWSNFGNVLQFNVIFNPILVRKYFFYKRRYLLFYYLFITNFYSN